MEWGRGPFFPFTTRRIGRGGPLAKTASLSESMLYLFSAFSLSLFLSACFFVTYSFFFIYFILAFKLSCSCALCQAFFLHILHITVGKGQSRLANPPILSQELLLRVTPLEWMAKGDGHYFDFYRVRGLLQSTSTPICIPHPLFRKKVGKGDRVKGKMGVEYRKSESDTIIAN